MAQPVAAATSHLVDGRRMVFSNALLVFLISIQFSTYGLMIDNTLQVFTGHIQVQAPGYKDDLKMRQFVPDVSSLASSLRRELGMETIAARAAAFALASSEERSYGLQIFGVETDFEFRTRAKLLSAKCLHETCALGSATKLHCSAAAAMVLLPPRSPLWWVSSTAACLTSIAVLQRCRWDFSRMFFTWKVRDTRL
jgi:hypothetical protein